MQIWHLRTCALFHFLFSRLPLSFRGNVMILDYTSEVISTVRIRYFCRMLPRLPDTAGEKSESRRDRFIWERAISRSVQFDWEWPLERCQAVKMWSSGLINYFSSMICMNWGLEARWYLFLRDLSITGTYWSIPATLFANGDSGSITRCTHLEPLMESHSLDDNARNYSPDTCVWINIMQTHHSRHFPF